MSHPPGNDSNMTAPEQELGYLQMPSNLNLGDDFFDRPVGEAFGEKAMRKSRENPFVPIGKLDAWTLESGRDWFERVF